MHIHLQPSRASELVPFQTCSLETLSSSEFASARCGVSEDGTLTWVYSHKGAVLEVVSTASGQRVASLNAEHLLRAEEANIACVCEFQCQGRAQLLVAINDGSAEQGMVVLLDVPSSMLVKAVEIPHQVTAVEKVLTYGGGNIPSWALCEQLRQFYGIVAVGTEGGYVYLVDMSLDSTSTVDSSEKVRPFPLLLLEPREREVEALRQQASAAGQHLALQLGVDEQTHSNGSFHFRGPDLSVVESFSEDDVQVSSIKYLPQCGTLAIGYSFGGYHLWKLFNPVLEYTSPVEPEDLPVAAFVYQEPENDPKNFAYLWVCRDDHLSDMKMESVCSVSLYQLSYSRRTFYANYGNFYDELNSLALRLEHRLTVEPYNNRNNNTWCSQLLSAMSIIDPNYHPSSGITVNDSFDEGCQGPDLSLCAFVWEAQGSAPGSPTEVYLGIFDMNRWYHAQMPSRIKCVNVGGQEVCPYFAVYRMTEAVNKEGFGTLLDIQLQSHKLLRFISNSPMPPEQHFYPSSLAFDAVCVLSNGIVSTSVLGVQRQVLASFDLYSPSCLLKPFDLYHRCLQAGLIARSSETASAARSTEEQQRMSLLTLALEQGKLRFITACIRSWADGEYYQQGCTLQFLLHWAWARVTAIKQQIDTTCKPLFDWSGAPVDLRMLQTLHGSLCCLGHLKTVLHALLTQSSPVTDQGQMELEHRIQVVTLLHGHLKVILWFIHSGLLPEHEETEKLSSAQYVYPASELSQVFKDRRQQMRQLMGSTAQTQDTILIDALVHSAGDSLAELWKKEDGSGVYPPPSLHAAVSMYLLDSVEEKIKHTVMLYLLFDMAAVADGQQEQFAEKIPRFARAFDVPLPLVQQVHGFWLIDHMNFEEGLKQLQLGSGQDLGPWQHRCILGALMYQGDEGAALRYLSLRNPPALTSADLKMRLSILVANRLVHQAMAYVRNSCGVVDQEEMLKHIFVQCKQRKMMELLFKLPLTEKEEKCLQGFLSTSTDTAASELLVLHLLQRAQYVPAIQLNDRLKHRATMDKSSKARERSKTRNSVVEGFLHCLPATQQYLVNNPTVRSTLPTTRKIDVLRPKPLSTMVTQRAERRANSKSSLILAVMDKVAEAGKLLAEEEGDGNGGRDEEMTISAPPPVHKKDHPDRAVSEAVVINRPGPFLCTPTTPRSRTCLSLAGQVVFPSVRETTRALLSSSTLLSPTVASTSRRSRVFTADCMSLLQTPKIDHTPARVASPLQRTTTPHSILKVSRMAHSSSRAKDVGKSRVRPKQLGFSASSSAEHSPALPSTPTSLTPSSTPSPTSTVSPMSFKEKTPHSKVDKSAAEMATPKQIRFAEPETREISPYVSPDSLSRPPLRTSPPYENSPSEPEKDSVAEEALSMSDEEITFNLCRQETEPMDTKTDSDSSTLPLATPSSDSRHPISPFATPSRPVALDKKKDIESQQHTPFLPSARDRLTRSSAKEDHEEKQSRGTFKTPLRDRSPISIRTAEENESRLHRSRISPKQTPGSLLQTSSDQISVFRETKQQVLVSEQYTEQYEIKIVSEETVQSAKETTVVLEKSSLQDSLPLIECQDGSTPSPSHSQEAVETIDPTEEEKMLKLRHRNEKSVVKEVEKTDIIEFAGEEDPLDFEINPPTPIQPAGALTPEKTTRTTRTSRRTGLKIDLRSSSSEKETDTTQPTPPKLRRLSPGKTRSSQDSEWSDTMPPLQLEVGDDENTNDNHMQIASSSSLSQGADRSPEVSGSRWRSAERSPTLSPSQRSTRVSVDRSPPISPSRRSTRKSAERSPPPSPSQRSTRASVERLQPVSPSRRSTRKSAERSPPPSPSQRSMRASVDQSLPVSPSRRSTRKSVERSPPPSPSRRTRQKSEERAHTPERSLRSRDVKETLTVQTDSEEAAPPPASPTRYSTRARTPERSPARKARTPERSTKKAVAEDASSEAESGQPPVTADTDTTKEMPRSPSRRTRGSSSASAVEESTEEAKSRRSSQQSNEDMPKSPSRRSTRRSKTPDIVAVPQVQSPSRRQTQQTAVDQSIVTPSSPGRLRKRQEGVIDEEPSSSTTASSSRRTRSSKTESSSVSGTTSAEETALDTASSSKETDGQTEDSSLSPPRRLTRARSKTPERSPARSSTRLRSKDNESAAGASGQVKDIAMVTEEVRSSRKQQRESSTRTAVSMSPAAEETGDAPSFQFAPPTPLSGPQAELMPGAPSNVSVYIFSPPITQSRRSQKLLEADRAKGKTTDSTQSMEDVAEERSTRKKGRATRSSKRKTKGRLVPSASPTDSPISLLSPGQSGSSAEQAESGAKQTSRQLRSGGAVQSRVLRKRKAKLW